MQWLRKFDRGARIRARLIRGFLQIISREETLRSLKCISTAQARRNWWAGAGAFFACPSFAARAFADLAVTIICGQRKGNLPRWWSQVDSSQAPWFCISEQAQHLGHGGLRRALNLWSTLSVDLEAQVSRPVKYTLRTLKRSFRVRRSALRRP